MIGIFDSGVGGLSVWQEIARQLPHHDTLYVADQAHVPYGSRPLAEVRDFALAITRFLLEQDCRVIVLACNTASAAALHHLRKNFPHTPFVGMEPAVKPAARNSRSGVIGVIATPATFQGKLFASLVERFGQDVQTMAQICPGLVEAVESGAVASDHVEGLLHVYLQPLLEAGVDQLVLGCTHYPFLQPLIQRIAGPGVEVVNPAPALARQVGRVLARQQVAPSKMPEPTHRFFTTGTPTAFASTIGQQIGIREEVGTLAWQDGVLQLATATTPEIGICR